MDKRFIAGFLFLSLALLMACSSSQSTTRKCNGKRGVRTPMGVM